MYMENESGNTAKIQEFFSNISALTTKDYAIGKHACLPKRPGEV
jgi:hypothetical protein